MDKLNSEQSSVAQHQRSSQSCTSPGALLIAGLTAMLCWLLTGMIGYTSPSRPFQDDFTVMALFLWLPQAFAFVYFIVVAGERGWSTPAATLSAIIVGLSAAVAWGVCFAQWGNIATRVFWSTAGIYTALGLEAYMGVAEGAERGIARLIGE